MFGLEDYFWTLKLYFWIGVSDRLKLYTKLYNSDDSYKSWEKVYFSLKELSDNTIDNIK